MEAGRYPTTSEGFAALVTTPADFKGDWPKEGFLPKIPKDAWNNDFVYSLDGSAFQVISYGADGKEGGEDENADISSSD